MPTIDIVLSAYVGGSTGKSLFTHMRTAYRLDSNNSSQSHPSVVLVIDASHGSALYETICTLFGRGINHIDKETLGRTCYYYMHVNNDNTFIAVRPKSKLVLSPTDLIEIFQEVAKQYKRIFRHLPNIDHIICETNLPHDSVATSEIIQHILALWEMPQIHLWSTWNTSSLLAQVEYNRIHQLYRNVSSLGIQWSHVHNPFSTTAGQPEQQTSDAMKECFNLDLTHSVNPFELRDSCYIPAFHKALDTEAMNEDIWKAAYQKYITQGTRPANILPIYSRSDYWGRILLTKYHYSINGDLRVHNIEDPKQFPLLIDQLSEKMYSDIFFKYFEQIQNNSF